MTKIGADNHQSGIRPAPTLGTKILPVARVLDTAMLFISTHLNRFYKGEYIADSIRLHFKRFLAATQYSDYYIVRHAGKRHYVWLS